MLLTLAGEGDLHFFLRSKGISCFSVPRYEGNKLSVVFFHTKFLIQFCKEYQINTVWSHLHPCNLYAVFAQYFCRTKFIIFRHHFHAEIKTEGFKNLNQGELWYEKLICLLAKKIVVPSSEVYRGMVDYEYISPNKIQIIPYIYNFNLYNNPNLEEVAKIKNQYKAELRIIIASRMIRLKRHFLILPVLKKLIEEGLDIEVLLLDTGELKEAIEDYIEENHLSRRIHMIGYQKNIIDYICATDIVVHPSATEASSSLIKEAGYQKKAVIVCEGVGDFDEYIENGINGMSVKVGKESQEFENYIRQMYYGELDIKKLGENLYHTVIDKFTPSLEVMNKYYQLIS